MFDNYRDIEAAKVMHRSVSGFQALAELLDQCEKEEAAVQLYGQRPETAALRTAEVRHIIRKYLEERRGR